MTINERIKDFRKSIVQMSQREFADKLGMKQTSVSTFERPGGTVTDPTIKALCLAFNLSEDWVRYGTEPMYIQQPTFSLDQFVRYHQGTDLEIEIMKAYFELDPDIRKTVLDHFKAGFSAAAQAETAASEPSVEDLEAEYKKSVLGSAQKTGFTASSTTEGTAVTGGQTNKVSNQ